jgi:two-component system, cell cycle sensor histidine kinase and response regulator CckA
VVRTLLPATAELDAKPEPSAQPERKSGGETILVVEDEDAMREVTRRILTRHGYEVIVAASGAEALAIAERRASEIDVLVTDVVMPQMLGKEVADRVRAIRPGLHVLYMSGYAQPVSPPREPSTPA